MRSKIARRLVFGAVAGFVVLTIIATIGWRFFFHSYEGYFSPVFSPDRDSVYFIERRTRGLVWGLGMEHFTPPAHAYVLQDRISLKRLGLATGQVQSIVDWPPSPLVRRHIRTYRNRIFTVLTARLQFRDDGQLHYSAGLSIPVQPRSESWFIRGQLSPENELLNLAETWTRGDRGLTGYARYVLDGDWELIHFFGRAAYPPAIVLFNEKRGNINILRRAPGFEAQYPDGIPMRLLAERSVRDAIERLDELKSTRRRLMAQFQAQGLSEGEALIRTGKALQELGYYPKPAMLTARAVNELNDDAAVFRISEREFQVGLFQDIARAIDEPGRPVEHSVGTYVRHRDFDTSEKLKKFLKDGGSIFYVQTTKGVYRLEVTAPQPATR